MQGTEEEQIGPFRDPRSDWAILQAVAQPVFSCFAALPDVIPALMSLSVADSLSPEAADVPACCHAPNGA